MNSRIRVNGVLYEAVDKKKSKNKKFQVGNAYDMDGLTYEVVSRTQRTVTFHITGKDKNLGDVDGSVDMEIKYKITRNKNGNDQAFVIYGNVLSA